MRRVWRLCKSLILLRELLLIVLFLKGKTVLLRIIYYLIFLMNWGPKVEYKVLLRELIFLVEWRILLNRGHPLILSLSLISNWRNQQKRSSKGIGLRVTISLCLILLISLEVMRQSSTQGLSSKLLSLVQAKEWRLWGENNFMINKIC